ncbi:MAG: hypothetical protein JWM19_272 [Actinomycetia bacterium]|nr:hypothetical protein [Actinomycetes bacterium]
MEHTATRSAAARRRPSPRRPTRPSTRYLSQPSLLLASNVGDDGSGAHAYNGLRNYGVETTARMVDGRPTPHVVVVGDNHHTGTFSRLF